MEWTAYLGAPVPLYCYVFLLTPNGRCADRLLAPPDHHVGPRPVLVALRPVHSVSRPRQDRNSHGLPDALDRVVCGRWTWSGTCARGLMRMTNGTPGPPHSTPGPPHSTPGPPQARPVPARRGCGPAACTGLLLVQHLGHRHLDRAHGGQDRRPAHAPLRRLCRRLGCRRRRLGRHRCRSSCLLRICTSRAIHELPDIR